MTTDLLGMSTIQDEKPHHLMEQTLSSEDEEMERELLLPQKPAGEHINGASVIVNTSRSGGTGFLFVLTVFAALGGFLFGYDTGVVSGAMIRIREYFVLDSTWQELIVSVTIAAAAIAAALGGPFSDILGRRITILIASIVFTVGAVVMGVAPDKWVLLIGRIVVGFGIGFAAMAVPMYIAESAPAEMRGKLVVVNNLFITGGQFVATVIDGAFSYLPLGVGWRLMLGLAGVPSFVMFLGFLFMPETPRWLVFHNKRERARRVLRKLRPADDVEEELQSIVEDYEEYKESKMGFVKMVHRFFTTRSVLLALLVGCGLQMFQQFGGINTVMYYSASIIQMAGFSDQDAIWLATVPGFGNFIFTIVGLLLVDRIGRRKLLIGSTTGVILSLLLLSGTFALMDFRSPPAKSVYTYNSLNDSCDFHSCGACVGNSKCGYCIDYDPSMDKYINGTCSLGSTGVDSSGHVVSYSYYRPTFVYNGTNGTVLCGLYSDPWNEEALSVETQSEFVEIEGSGAVGSAMIPLNSSLQRKWSLNSCPNNNLAPLAIIAMLIYIAFFAPGMGPLPWTVNSEIYPTWARSSAIAIATTVNWLSNLIVSMTFLTLTDGIGQPATFGLYAGLGLLGLLFVVFLLPETKGKTLEEVEELFERPYCTQWCRGKSQNKE